MPVFAQATDLIGHTPLVTLSRYARSQAAPVQLYAKVEFFNPAGSVKDRTALALIEDGKNRGLLTPGAVIIEPTSGNTGIALAAIGTPRGYRVILTMPDTMSTERQKLLKAYGAEVVLTDGTKGMKGAIEKARELAAQTPNSFIPNQFENPANPAVHYRTTGPEIWQDTDGKLDIFVAGVGTGGTISGVGKYLKEKNPAIRVIAVEPATSPVLSGGKPGPHGLQGIGAGFIPHTLDTEIYDEIIPIENESAFEAARQCARTEGLLIGISAGAALAAATQLSKRPENKDKKIAVLFPDGGERYLSTALFDEQR